jgi:predicted nuclease with TOPRIM domain
MECGCNHDLLINGETCDTCKMDRALDYAKNYIKKLEVSNSMLKESNKKLLEENDALKKKNFCLKKEISDRSY